LPPRDPLRWRAQGFQHSRSAGFQQSRSRFDEAEAAAAAEEVAAKAKAEEEAAAAAAAELAAKELAEEEAVAAEAAAKAKAEEEAAAAAAVAKAKAEEEAAAADVLARFDAFWHGGGWQGWMSICTIQFCTWKHDQHHHRLWNKSRSWKWDPRTKFAEVIGGFNSSESPSRVIGTKSEVAQHKTKCVFSPEAITQIKRLTSAATTS
jgi:hypothetical protein